MEITAFDLAQRWIGVAEAPGIANNPDVVKMLRLVDTSVVADEVPWCSGFVNFIAWALRLPRSKSLAARSWLTIGRSIALEEAKAENDVVILERDGGGHVGFFAGREGENVLLLGGNQRDAVNVSAFPIARVLGVRRLMI